MFKYILLTTTSNFLFAFIPLFMVSAQEQKKESTISISNMELAYPNWSPKGDKIVFMSNMLDDNNEIYVMNSDGTERKRITFNQYDDRCPSWSPDGKRIVFVRRSDSMHDVFVMNSDGSDQFNVTNSISSIDGHPKFFPNGKTIVYNSSRDTPQSWPDDKYDYDIFQINTDGTNRKKLVSNLDGWDSYPSISPDGKKLLWRRVIPVEGEEQGNSEVFISNTDGSDIRNLTNHPGFDGYPTWSLDGTKILYASQNTGTDEEMPPSLFIMNPDGTSKTAITEFSSSKADLRPWFSPDGDKVIFNRIHIGQQRMDIIIKDIENH